MSERTAKRYAQLKAARLCVDCRAGLQDDDGVRCIECAADRSRRSLNYARQHPEVQRAYLTRARDRVNAYRRDLRTAKKLARICIDCTEPCLDDNLRCRLHRDAAQTRVRESWRRLHGSDAIREIAAVAHPIGRPAGPRRPMLRAPTEPALPPIVAPEDAATTRVLRALRWLEWPGLAELIDAVAGLTNGGDSGAYNAWTQVVVRAVRRGWVEARGPTGGRDYALTASGRVQLDRVCGARRAA